MTRVLETIAIFFMTFGVFVFAFGLVYRPCFRVCLPLGLDFWVAAGLIRLTGVPGWNALGVAAAAIFIRKLVSRSLA